MDAEDTLEKLKEDLYNIYDKCKIYKNDEYYKFDYVGFGNQVIEMFELGDL